MLTRDEKQILRILFQNKIYKANGQAFEDLFTAIMNYSNLGFRSIKPWGNMGDRKNDGYIPESGVFFQVYAPEDIENSYPNVIKKLKTDFAGLVKQWNQPVKEFYFVVNDKYKGVNADAEQTIQEIIKTHKLQNGGFKTANDLENLLFLLEDDQIIMITGNLPEKKNLNRLNYSILNEVIDHIMSLSLSPGKSPAIILPDWDEKIKFNNLTDVTKSYLNIAYIQVINLENYLSDNSDFLADELRDKLNEIYQEEKIKSSGDNLFWNIVVKASPKQEQSYQSAVIIIMSKYFESCDIFEEPTEAKI